ncbi:hypothetical protein ASE14_15750 [Agromyces sp. Root81]|uniref:hypothetical protein n=1 Tax=Agromyces sp. Root81 TaxID=1736601 RepID=UPI0006FF995A|nr:hypothetical protein [Agromyces sp. Root81]KRC59219.1 hypothetical protein ASE14_15750 [Agromyces sp. Root81]
MTAVFRLFPWDVEGDPDAAASLARRGVERVALAATYHAARVATPRHPLHRVVELRTSASYLGRLGPLPEGPWSFDPARDALQRAGIAVDAWIVLGHLDGVRPDLPRVVNAFGDELSHALCLSSPASRRFVIELAGAAFPTAAGGTAWLEALGWLALPHGSLHEKTAGADFDARQIGLLGRCMCDECLDGLMPAPDRDGFRAGVRAAVDGAMDPPGMDGLLANRERVVDTLHEEVAALAAQHDVELRIAAEDTGAGRRSQVYVGCWGDVEQGRAALARAARHDRRVAYVTILDGDPQGFAAHWAALAESGADELHVYHAGLASDRRLEAAIRAVEVFDEARRARRPSAVIEPPDTAAPHDSRPS